MIAGRVGVLKIQSSWSGDGGSYLSKIMRWTSVLPTIRIWAK